MSLPADLLPILLRVVCALYLSAALVHVLLQSRYAAHHARRHTAPRSGNPAAAPLPAVDVIVPCYNEDPALLDACLASIASQDYQGRLRVSVVDDGSSNRSELLPVLWRHDRRPGWQMTLLPQRMGKRRAVDAALWSSDGDVVVTVDSDTVLLDDAVRQLVPPFADDRVGAVSASLRVLNADQNRLTRLINRHYWLLFEQERAAQGHFRAVLCCNGGLSAFRRTALRRVWARHVDRRCTTGDDLHLTLQLLASGYDAVYAPGARALTTVPATLHGYARQQLRWNRSHLRELPLAARAVANRSTYLAVDLAARTISPLLLATTLLLYAAEGAVLGPLALARDLVLVAATLASTSTLPALQARDPHYVLYCAVYLGVVVPGWLRALTSPAHDSWSTRDLRR